MWIKLIRKLADRLDGIDVSLRRVGEPFEVSRAEGELLIAEGWAEQLRPPALTLLKTSGRRRAPIIRRPSVSAEPEAPPAPRPIVRTLELLRQVRQQLEQRTAVELERRRAEDQIREELHDARARTVRIG